MESELKKITKILYAVLACNVVVLFTTFLVLNKVGKSEENKDYKEETLKQSTDSLSQSGSTNKLNLDVADLVANQKPNIRMIQASIIDYLDKEIILYGYARLDDYYNCGYRDAMNTHYSIRLYESMGVGRSISIYFPKKGNKKIFDLLGMSKERVPLKVHIILKSSRYDNDSVCNSFFEGLKWETVN